MTRQPVPDLSDDYEWVEVKALQRFNISKRPWSGGRNIGLTEGENYILPRGRKNGDGYAAGMKFYYENDGFLELVDANPNLDLTDNSSTENNTDSDDVDYRSKTKDELQDMCEEQGLKKTGKKDELIDRLKNQ